MKNSIRFFLVFPLGLLAGMFSFCLSVQAAEMVISEDTVWEKGEVKVIDDPEGNGLIIMPGAKLTINPGVIIKLGKNNAIFPMGELAIQGSAAEPVIITSLKDDSAGGDTNGEGNTSTPAPGDWYGILSNGQGAKVSIDYAKISYGGGRDDSPSQLIMAYQINSFSLTHSSLKYNTGAIFFGQVESAKINFSNIYLDESSCHEEEGIRYCEMPSINYYGEGTLEAANNFWSHAQGPTLMESISGPEDIKGIFISGNINYTPYLSEEWKSEEEEEALEPVIIVPGIMGSWQYLNQWTIDPILHTYDNLIEAMIQSGYELNKNLFVFPYDWRRDNAVTASELKEKINEVKEETQSPKVDLVAHSMGGLISRFYVQSEEYDNDVDQLIFLGTPHNKPG